MHVFSSSSEIFTTSSSPFSCAWHTLAPRLGGIGATFFVRRASQHSRPASGAGVSSFPLAATGTICAYGKLVFQISSTPNGYWFFEAEPVLGSVPVYSGP